VTEPMTDKRLKWLEETGGCDTCDSNWTECVWEIHRLREENAALIEGIRQGKVLLEYDELIAENAKLRKAVDTALRVIKGESVDAKDYLALRKLDEETDE